MIYFDNAATTRPDGEALKRAAEFATEVYFNPSAKYGGGFAVFKKIGEMRDSLLKLSGASGRFDLIFTSCGSEADDQAIFSSAKRGNAVTTAGEHAAVFASFTELKNRGVEPRFAPIERDGSVKAESILSLVDEKTSLVSVVHVNNETGAVNDIAAIAKAVKAKNPRTVFMSDGVQAFGKLPFVLPPEVDLYAVSAHKIGGLKGTGALFKRKNLSLAPYIYGGGQENGLRSGTENTFGIAVFAYAAEQKFRTLKEDAERLGKARERLFSGLDRDVFTRISPQNGSPYILTVSAEGMRGEVLQRMLWDRGLCVGTGSACSSKNRFSRVITACGYGERVLDGVLRMSFSPATTEEEIGEAITILNATAKEYQNTVLTARA